MFRPPGGNQRASNNNSESESDWDTTSEFPTPRQHTVNDSLHTSVKDDIQQKPPTPRTRVTTPGRGDKADDGTPSSARGDDAMPVSARQESNQQTSAPPAYLSATGEAGARNPSPVPPYTSGFREAIKNDDDISRTGRSSPSPRPSSKAAKYERSRTPSVSRLVEAETISEWDDSDADEQTLREVHTTFKKEKSRELESETSRRQFQGESQQRPGKGQQPSVLEQWMQGREQRKKPRNAMSSTQAGKTGQTAIPMYFSKGGDPPEPSGMDAPYQSFVVKDQDGKRFVYYFNEGNTSFYEVEEENNEAVMPKIADKVEKIIQRGWQEFFGALRIVMSVIVYLFIEALNFCTDYVARPLLQAALVIVGNHLVKPSLAAMFNLIVQPLVIFMWNVMSGIRHVCQPAIDVFGRLMSKVAIALQAFRLVTVETGGRGGGGGGEQQRQEWRVMGLRGYRGARSESEIV